MKLWKHILKILHEYGGAKVSAPELARAINRIGEYKGSPQDLDRLTRMVRRSLETCCAWGYVGREAQQRKFGGGFGSTSGYFYYLRPGGTRVLEHEGMI